MTFEELTAVERTDDLQFSATVPQTWEQGRGAYGGLVVATLVNAMQAAEPDKARVLRSVSADLCGPVPAGEVTIDVKVLRRGNKLSSLDARMHQGGEIFARASTILATDRGIETPSLFTPPEGLPDWRTMAPAPIGPPIAPVFTQHLEFRPTNYIPFSGGDVPRAEGWVRFKDRAPRMEAATIIGLLDSFWPTTLAVSTTLRPTATVAFTAQILCDLHVLDPDEPLFYRANAVAGHGGYFLEVRELWSGDTPVGMNQQTFAIIK